MMNKWINRIIGMIVVAVILAFFLNKWLNPNIPDAIDKQIDITVANQPVTNQPEQTNRSTDKIDLLSTQENEAANSTQSDAAIAGQKAASVPDTPKLEITALLNEPDTGQTKQTDAATAKPAILTNPDSQNTSAWLHAGSFSERDNAVNRLQRIKSLGWTGEIEKAVVKGKVYYRVYIGPIRHGDVSDYLAKLKGMKIMAREINR